MIRTLKNIAKNPDFSRYRSYFKNIIQMAFCTLKTRKMNAVKHRLTTNNNGKTRFWKNEKRQNEPISLD